eukprot:TRINITY_DN1419_c0_g1_i1.p1 TRINITY_DN1419_c0_g1~~TRINITY_DN1419_c0_g1_i1.p1  ORF type:complete len:128 (+),score=44.04 TRINITY_DN1419_c0_g1_i1:192-575(+)
MPDFSLLLQEAIRITKELLECKVPSKDSVTKILYLLRHDVHEDELSEWLFDQQRATGVPYADIVDRSVPQGLLEGFWHWKQQQEALMDVDEEEDFFDFTEEENEENVDVQSDYNVAKNTTKVVVFRR